MNNLGNIYASVDIKKDYNKAKQLYKTAIELGSLYASANLADMYLKGKGVKKDFNKALELCDKQISIVDDSHDIQQTKNHIETIFTHTTLLKPDDNTKSICERLILSTKLKHNEKRSVVHYYSQLMGSNLVNDMIKLIQLQRDLKKITDENEQLKTHIAASPDGELYFAAQEHWNSCTH